MIEINKNQPTAYDTVFPVFGGKINENGHFEPLEIYGTAFYINNNFFLTCAHTIENANSIGIIAIGADDGNGVMTYTRVRNFETFKKNDSGLIQAHIPRAKANPWLNQKLAMLNNVFSIGYPYGFDNEYDEILIRAFKGHIMLVGYNNDFSKSPHYELSYSIPRGLSGGPLIFVYQNIGMICGMTIGNKITDMIVDSFKEEQQDGGKITIYERTESLHRGIAMQTSSFYDIESKLLNGTFLEYLNKNNMLM